MFYNKLMTYLLRVNLDIDTKAVKQDLRFQDTAISIKGLHKSTNKVVVLAHRGRPSKKDKKLSLKPLVRPLSELIGKRVTFLPDFDFAKIKEKITKAPNGSIFLLENVRFLPGEVKGNKALAKKYASLADRFVNDDFPTSHHVNASNVEVAKLLPSSLGPNFKAELKALDTVMRAPKKPLVLIIGGAKIDDKLGVIKNLFGRVDTILLGGGPANTVLKARGVKVGSSLYDSGALKTIKPWVQNQKLITPVDWKTKDSAILDIGPQSERLYRDLISIAKTIVWNGPMGKVEQKAFAHGTEVVAKAVFANKEANIVIGGGDTLSAITVPQEASGRVFVSTGGGAMLTYLAGEKLPVLKVIK